MHLVWYCEQRMNRDVVLLTQIVMLRCSMGILIQYKPSPMALKYLSMSVPHRL